ncbi:hypothetical protein Tco_0702501 [Tanacetum coccineum]|uniref:Uncharacterized protein n=1 Tax=Tanacetum coccineum TaxID=301880 RepID=A0ABQ4XW47_9ASTR
MGDGGVGSSLGSGGMERCVWWRSWRDVMASRCGCLDRGGSGDVGGDEDVLVDWCDRSVGRMEQCLVPAILCLSGLREGWHYLLDKVAVQNRWDRSRPNNSNHNNITITHWLMGVCGE